ncbi:MAG: bifunctional folylpolyglutamate synthase/dihydrofolate synthase [Lachnospiraceae bacterium]
MADLQSLWDLAAVHCHSGIVLGLDCMRKLMDFLGNPQNQIPSVHIAGTNGKGSVLAMLSSVLTEAGYKTGAYSSPALFDRREQYRINGGWAPTDKLADCLEMVLEANEQLKKESGRYATSFELETALAFVYFQKEHCDIMVIECGMGGDEDATNVMNRKVCAVLTAISLDHTKFLGKTLTEIASHKTGIVMNNIPVVLYEQECEVMSCVSRYCAEKNAPFTIAKVSESFIIKMIRQDNPHLLVRYHGLEMELPFLGVYQKENVAVAVEVWRVLQGQGYAISEEVFLRGVKKTRWPGRMEVLAKFPLLVADGAHNPAGAEQLRHSLEFCCPKQTIVFIMGIFQDKDYQEILHILLPLARTVITIQSDSPRALPAEKLKQEINQMNPQIDVMAAHKMTEALAAAKEKVQPTGVICACGSLSFMKELYEAAGRSVEDGFRKD